MRIFEIDDEAEAGVGGAAQDVGTLRDDVLGFDRLAVELGLGERLLEAGKGEVVIGLVAESALRDDERDRRRRVGGRGGAAPAGQPEAQADRERPSREAVPQHSCSPLHHLVPLCATGRMLPQCAAADNGGRRGAKWVGRRR